MLNKENQVDGLEDFRRTEGRTWVGRRENSIGSAGKKKKKSETGIRSPKVRRGGKLNAAVWRIQTSSQERLPRIEGLLIALP